MVVELVVELKTKHHIFPLKMFKLQELETVLTFNPYFKEVLHRKKYIAEANVNK